MMDLTSRRMGRVSTSARGASDDPAPETSLGDLPFDGLGHERVGLGQPPQHTDELPSVHLQEPLFEGGHLPHGLRVVERGEQNGDDVLAPPAPFVRAAARRSSDIRRIKGDAHLVRREAAAFDLRPKLLAPPYQRGHTTPPVILPAPAQRFGGGVLLDQGFAKVEQLSPSDPTTDLTTIVLYPCALRHPGKEGFFRPKIRVFGQARMRVQKPHRQAVFGAAFAEGFWPGSNRG
jgi:hypothetical protein